MKNKIVGIFVCMLLIATAVPAVVSLKNSAINATVPSHPLASMAGSWAETQKLLAGDGAADDSFGYIVSLDGNTALIGAPEGSNGHDPGSAYVFTRTGTTWTLQQKLNASDGAADDSFGVSVSLAGNTALIGAFWDDDNGADSGSAYVFTRTGTIWTQQQKLLPSDGGVGDWFGWVASLDGDTALIGAPQNDDNGVDSGSAYVFTRTGTTWTQQAKLLALDGAAGDWFGTCVSLDGDTALISAVLDNDNGHWSGSAYVFTRTGTTWTQQQKLIASDGAANDQFGCWVSLDGDAALIGAPFDDDNGVDSGSAYVFTKGGIGIDITGGLGINAVITNHGITNVTDVTWQIHVEGGILGRINKTVNDTIDIPAGESKIVGTGMFFGLGPIAITVKVADYERTAEGTQFIIFSIVK